MFIPEPATCLFINVFRLIRIKTGIATAGNIRAWNACENTIRSGGVVSINCIPNPKRTPINPRIRYIGE